MKRRLNLWLLAALLCGMSLGVTSCKDDADDNGGGGPEVTAIEDDKHSDEALSFFTCVNQLCGVSELPDDWRTATYTPTIGIVADESQPTVRTVYVANREEAAVKFVSLISDDVDPDDADLTTWTHDVLGTLSFKYDFSGNGGLLATVDVRSPRIPHLEQIRYVDSESMPANGDYFRGMAFYQLGDVVREEVPAVGEVFWICVRPAHPTLKGDSHWVSLSLDERRVNHYTSKRYPDAYVPTDLHASSEHLTNFCQLIYFMQAPEVLKSLMMSDMSDGLGGLDGLYDDRYVQNLAADWKSENVRDLVLPQALRKKLDELTSAQTDTMSFYVNGYHSFARKYLGVDKSVVSVKDHFVKVTTKIQDFQGPSVDFRDGWNRGNILVLQYRKGSELQKDIKGDQAFDANRFRTIYRYREHHEDLGQQAAIDGHYTDFRYKTVSATGESIVLSGMVGWPKSKEARDILIGCHVTVTNNSGAPTSWTGAPHKETNLLLDHLHDKNKPGYNCLVVLPDYEGYGNTADRQHPYLCQEITARQVTDAVLAAKKLFQEQGGSFRPGFKTISVGYSQGGSVAMATQRYIEEHRDIKEELNYWGAACGDGPYDPLATFRVYFDKGKLYMPVVIPLVLLSYCEYDPDMKKAHCTLEDFLTEQFLATGIVQWIKEKKLPTKDIQAQLKSYAKQHAALLGSGKDDWWYLRASDVVKPDVLAWFIFETGPDPELNKKCEALKKALERNRIWGDWSEPRAKPWQNETNLGLFHSTKDEVVPFENYENALKALTNYHGQRYQSRTVYGHVWTGRFFYLNYEIDLVQKVLSDGPMGNREETIGGILF